MVEAIGAPFDLAGYQLGSRLGPAAFELAGIGEMFQSINVDFSWSTIIVPGEHPPQVEGGLKNFGSVLNVVKDLKAATADVLDRGNMPMMVGGDHSLSMGSISAALNHFGEGLAVLWIDAHADLNTPLTSPSGNFHGMPIPALAGSPHDVPGPDGAEWASLLDLLGPKRLQFDNVAWLGLREVDQGERLKINELGDRCIASSMHDIDRYGLLWELRRFDAWMKKNGATHLWVSFDVDVLDPNLAPGTGTTVTGGLTYREAHLIAEVLYEFLQAPNCPYQLAGLDIVEINPLIDINNSTAKLAVGWVGSLFGKSILGKL